ncbi:hypothetical protein ACFLXI_01215 [Chloroflexota bacterium]
MNKYRLFWIVVFVIVLVLSACSSDVSEETGAIEPEPTAVANVPEQPEEKAPEEKVPVEPPEVSTGKNLFDAAAMVENLDDFVLRREDMPNQYKIATDGEQHLSNLKVINLVGEVDGKRYLAATTRMDGWSMELERVKKEDLIPYTIMSQIEVFETSEGAQTAFGPDWFHAYTDEERKPNWVEDGCDIGDACVMYYYEKLDPTTELTTLQYEVAFVYNNALAQVMGRGLDFDMKPDYVVEAAEVLYEKIDAGPMVVAQK